METKVLLPTEENLAFAAGLLNDGQVVGIPTETVYGLAANAWDENAVEQIFWAKGRPQDNPLIVHIASADMLGEVAAFVPETARLLARRFWPGPLTMIFEKSEKVPAAVTAGLSTVAVRFPSHKVARALIQAAGMPLAAPSANQSGSPSPTTANHVFNDLNGRIPAILDGGPCEVGLESTVILLREEGVVLLRPGAVTVAMLEAAVPHVAIDRGVLNELAGDEQPLSPGMKHKHYAPRANLIIIDSDFAAFRRYVEARADQKAGAMVFDGEETKLTVPCVTFGAQDAPASQARMLFKALRAADAMDVSTIYARMPDQDGLGLAIYNRLLRAAGFEVISL